MRNEAPTLSRCRQVALALLAVAWLSAPVLGADLYRVDGVAVDAVAESGVAAREVAIAKGRSTNATAYGVPACAARIACFSPSAPLYADVSSYESCDRSGRVGAGESNRSFLRAPRACDLQGRWKGRGESHYGWPHCHR